MGVRWDLDWVKLHILIHGKVGIGLGWSWGAILVTWMEVTCLTSIQVPIRASHLLPGDTSPTSHAPKMHLTPIQASSQSDPGFRDVHLTSIQVLSHKNPNPKKCKLYPSTISPPLRCRDLHLTSIQVLCHLHLIPKILESPLSMYHLNSI